MANDIIKLKGQDGTSYEVSAKKIGSGAKKDVYANPDKKFVAAFYRDPVDLTSLLRLKDLTGKYKNSIFSNDLWHKYLCWPYKQVTSPKGKIGLLLPYYPDHFFFKYGNIKGKEKSCDWFIKPITRKTMIDKKELGNWKKDFIVCLKLARALRRLHSAGLAHSDISYKNILIDPSQGNAMIIDLDELVVPGKYPAGVLGSPDFIAPEVMKTLNLKNDDPNKKLPSIQTDSYALGCLIYMILLHRHPLKGRKVHHSDAEKDLELTLGEKALFIENDSDYSNRPKIEGDRDMPWIDINRLPYKITGPLLSKLIKKNFQDGLHQPSERPMASEWENAILETLNLLTFCTNPNCESKWFVMNKAGRCPFCGSEYKGFSIPVFDIYKANYKNEYCFTGKQWVIYNGKTINKWDVFQNIYLNENINKDDYKRVGKFEFEKDRWFFENQYLSDLYIDGKEIKIGLETEIKVGSEIVFGKTPHGLKALVKMYHY